MVLPLLGVVVGVLLFEAAAVITSTAVCAGHSRNKSRYGGKGRGRRGGMFGGGAFVGADGGGGGGGGGGGCGGGGGGGGGCGGGGGS
jgi:hypothetical protein